ncbi:hypothetical protein ACUXAV_000653 [Cupriavidus metallidurans]|jgi:hypothetical protein|uniref:Uncharacterized protein n=1 Tax=Cupriavidus metallidurans TaxID=119219 RepID=A0A482IP91_9BURK|nr:MULTISPECIES: hypothetical protein [Cupriavidus]KWR79036.1 hypothetical protein RN01_22595 [Cupriavidus sp. SHE]MDE4918554.1 hypothetical protein [Cupriavidus metallidurans]QBP09373.1 hypothetical protein DDF84_006185 [Cupriavidus metallidurans]
MSSGRYKIISDGTATGTHLFDPDGKDITRHCTSIEWKVEADGFGIATVKYSFVDVNVEAVLEVEVGEDG